MLAVAVMLALIGATAAPAVTVDVRQSVRVGDVDVAFVEHSHRTALEGRNTGIFTFDLSRKGSPKQSVRLHSKYDDLFAEIDVGGALVLLSKVDYGTFDVRVASTTSTPMPAPLGEEECRALLTDESQRRGLTAPSGFTTQDGVVTMANDAFRGHCGRYTRRLTFFSGSYVRDAGVETHVFSGTSTRVGDVLVSFRGASPKHSKGDEPVTLVFELELEGARDGVVVPLTFTSELGREHMAELEAHGTALGLRAARGDEVHVRLIAKSAQPPLSLEECEARVNAEANKAGRKDAPRTSTVNADGIVTVKTTAWTARCGRYSGRITFP